MLQCTMDTLTTGDGLRLRLKRWPAQGPARGTVQIVHGLGEHIGRYESLAAKLNAAGWHVAGHDHRGHGRSEGARGGMGGSHSLLADLSAVRDHFAGPGRHILLGHSMGGLIAARFVAESLAPDAARWARDVDGLVLSSPALDAGLGPLRKLLLAVLGPLLPDLRLGNGLQPAWISRDPAVVRKYEADPLVHDRVTPRLVRFIVDAGARVRQRAPQWRTPTLLLWGGADRCVAPAGSVAFAAAAPAAVVTAQAFPLLFHEIFNEPERAEVIARVTGWLAQRYEFGAGTAG
ncbi:alpha/beta hydrolase [Brevundimonas sp.]|uniref:alpha/beta hydrolase n=1 Tax=Brevundimonas sp. TaxID=1871086 RepID=UPI002730437F|nr:alpha/beta hydrolase [Brevundimonas sp.]MDP1912261.1 lysophospholipase [Brevundimonas sp.]